MKKISIAMFGLILFVTSSQAQANSEKLTKLTKLLEDKIEGTMPGWTHRSVKPIEGSTNVIVELWESGNVNVKVAVLEYPSDKDAGAGLYDFKRQLEVEELGAAQRNRNLHLIKGDFELGDEGFIWDIMGSDAVAFRRNSFLVFVSTVGPREYKDVFLSKQFAYYVAAVLAAQCWVEFRFDKSYSNHAAEETIDRIYKINRILR
jgi:hypothetical protein